MSRAQVKMCGDAHRRVWSTAEWSFNNSPNSCSLLLSLEGGIFFLCFANDLIHKTAENFLKNDFTVEVSIANYTNALITVSILKQFTNLFSELFSGENFHSLAQMNHFLQLFQRYQQARMFVNFYHTKSLTFKTVERRQSFEFFRSSNGKFSCKLQYFLLNPRTFINYRLNESR